LTRIGLFSDTHDFLDETIFQHFGNCDEVWHVGDFGSLALVQRLKSGLLAQKSNIVLRGVYGNIDASDIRVEFPETLFFSCEEVKVMMQHIGGYPGRYAKGIKEQIIQKEIQLFISGHSHILKVMYDEKLACLHMNPGAAGKHGWHKERTILRFVIDKNEIKDCEIVELGPRSA